ncbi:hypothetical protein IGX29_04775 [Streptomyces sp. H28]|uniref:hypothetical protein n=1 Tax=Streptomyces sp. H28 TaxID=2775865 RepID=UPI0017831B03|nr:hypothetical protein [Streptomyces sp. H28]MBD9731139.1 hypothetical protein [Streptomyces sp. H28]
MKAEGIRRAARKSGFWRALVIPAAAVMAVPAVATEAQATHQRTVTGNLTMRIMDYESFGPNTVCNRNRTLVPRVVTVGTAKRITVRERCGGEIRVEVQYKLTHQEGGFIRVTEGVVKFFEGTSDNTTDLDGTAAFANIFLYPGQSTSRSVHVQNWNEGQPDDKADLTLTLRNP